MRYTRKVYACKNVVWTLCMNYAIAFRISIRTGVQMSICNWNAVTNYFKTFFIFIIFSSESEACLPLSRAHWLCFQVYSLFDRIPWRTWQKPGHGSLLLWAKLHLLECIHRFLPSIGWQHWLARNNRRSGDFQSVSSHSIQKESSFLTQRSIWWAHGFPYGRFQQVNMISLIFLNFFLSLNWRNGIVFHRILCTWCNRDSLLLYTTFVLAYSRQNISTMNIERGEKWLWINWAALYLFTVLLLNFAFLPF